MFDLPMHAFARLLERLDRTTRPAEAFRALEAYFRCTPPADAAWALWFLSGRSPKRVVKTADLRQWTTEAAALPRWLVDACCEHVGHLGETLALLLPPGPGSEPFPLGRLVEEYLLPLSGMPPAGQRALVQAAWAGLNTAQRLLWIQLITGQFRTGIPPALLTRALARIAGVKPAIITHRLEAHWQPTPTQLARILSSEVRCDGPVQPYPFHLARPLDGEPHGLGATDAWQIEWLWDGTRAQIVRRAGHVRLWSRAGGILNAGFPEIVAAGGALPDGTVLDGELLAWEGDGPLPPEPLQQRLRRREPSPARRPTVPVVFMAFDLLETGGVDVRQWALQARRTALEEIVRRASETPVPSGATSTGPAWVQPELFPGPPLPAVRPASLRLSPLLTAHTWADVAGWRARARAGGARGLMLKHRASAYGVGRPREAWYRWPAIPLTCTAVLVAGHTGPGRAAAPFTDYTFAVWDGGELVPVARTASGLCEADRNALDAFARTHLTGRKGPVRPVKPERVFELAFEAVVPSTRHQAGLTLRFPSVVRWCRDKTPSEADTVGMLRQLSSNLDRHRLAQPPGPPNLPP